MIVKQKPDPIAASVTEGESWRFRRTSHIAQLDNRHEHFRRTLDRTLRHAIPLLSLVLSDPFAQQVRVHAVLQRWPETR